MKLAWPRTLFSRLMLIWLVGIVVVLTTSITLFVGERDRHDRDLLVEGLAGELAAAVDVLDHLSPREREAWVETLGRRRLRFSLRPVPHDAHRLPDRIRYTDAFRRALPERDLQFYAHGRGDGHSAGAPGRVLVVVSLADGTRLSARLPLPSPPQPTVITPERAIAALAALILGVGLLAWIAVRVATRPLSRLADAARALGDDPNRPPLSTTGPAEVAQAAAAFNHMQERIREHVAERTRILAAISHDLQTPITRLRLRAEMIDDEHLRDRVQNDLDAMQALVREGLDYARSLDASAPRQPTDLNGLLAALAEDAHDLGWQVDIQGRANTPALCQPTAMRRVLWNLIENGVKFGGEVSLAVDEDADAHHIRIRDHGPGLPQAEMEKVFEPFYRGEWSRNRDTGGTGLGLAIARNLLAIQGGEVTLANHPAGGLEAHVRLPRGQASADARTHDRR